MAHDLRTAIDIDASPERVWAILMDFGAYPDWNPFIRSIEGDARRDGRLKVRIQPSGGRAMRFNPTVLAAEPSRELRWLGKLGVKGLFDGEHSFRLEPTASGCTTPEGCPAGDGLGRAPGYTTTVKPEVNSP